MHCTATMQLARQHQLGAFGSAPCVPYQPRDKGWRTERHATLATGGRANTTSRRACARYSNVQPPLSSACICFTGGTTPDATYVSTAFAICAMAR